MFFIRKSVSALKASVLLTLCSIKVLLLLLLFSSIGTLMILKSACSNNPSYIDRLISVFMRSLQKMVREHLNPQATAGAAETNTGIPLHTLMMLVIRNVVKY